MSSNPWAWSGKKKYGRAQHSKIIIAIFYIPPPHYPAIVKNALQDAPKSFIWWLDYVPEKWYYFWGFCIWKYRISDICCFEQMRGMTNHPQKYLKSVNELVRSNTSEKPQKSFMRGGMSSWHIIKNCVRSKTTNINITSKRTWKYCIIDISGFDQWRRHD